MAPTKPSSSKKKAPAIPASNLSAGVSKNAIERAKTVPGIPYNALSVPRKPSGVTALKPRFKVDQQDKSNALKECYMLYDPAVKPAAGVRIAKAVDKYRQVSGVPTYDYCFLFVDALTDDDLDFAKEQMMDARKFTFSKQWRMNNPAQFPLMVHVYEQFRYEYYHDWDKYSAAFFKNKAGSDGDTAVAPADFGDGVGKDFALGCKFMSGLKILFPDMEPQPLWEYGQEILQTKIKHTNQVENYLANELYEQCEDEAIQLLPDLKRLHLRGKQSKMALNKICTYMGIKTDVANPNTSGIRTLFNRLKTWHKKTMTEQEDANSKHRRNDWKLLETLELAKMKFEREADDAKAEALAEKKEREEERKRKRQEKAAQNAPKRAKIVEKLEAIRAGTYELTEKEMELVGEDEDPMDVMVQLEQDLVAALHKLDGTKAVTNTWESEDEDAPPTVTDPATDPTEDPTVPTGSSTGGRQVGIQVRNQLETYELRLSKLSQEDQKLVIDLDAAATDSLKTYREHLVQPNSVTAKQVKKNGRNKASWAIAKPDRGWVDSNNKTFRLLFQFVHLLTSTKAFQTTISGTMKGAKPAKKLQAIKSISDKLNFGKVPSESFDDWGKAAGSWLHMYTGEQYLTVLTFLELWVGSFHNLQTVVEEKMLVAEKVLAMKQAGFSMEEASHTLMVLWTIADLPNDE